MFEIHVSPYCLKVKVDNDHIDIHDTTLREGEQTPGVVFTLEDKLRIAEMLFEVGVDRVEAGFPASSEFEKRAVKQIAKEFDDKRVFGFARAVRRDVDEVINCDCGGILLSFPPSDIHLKYKLRMDRKEYLDKAISIVEYIKSHGLKIVYSAEDASRTEYDWLLKVFRSVKEAGADICRIADTVGCITPTAMNYLVRRLISDVGCDIEVHCHNDHGLALANSLAAFEAGAVGISTAVLGLGERTGIAATEELILALHNFYGVKKFKVQLLTELCQLVSRIAKFKIWPTKPVVGQNAFTHYSGIHQDGVIKNPIVYESYPPELVGGRRRILLGGVTGRAAVKLKLKELGIEDVNDELIAKITEKVKEASYNRKSALTDEELLELLEDLGVNIRGDAP